MPVAQQLVLGADVVHNDPARKRSSARKRKNGRVSTAVKDDQREVQELLLAVTDLAPHASLLTPYFSAPFSGLLGTHLVHAPVFSLLSCFGPTRSQSAADRSRQIAVGRSDGDLRSRALL